MKYLTPLTVLLTALIATTQTYTTSSSTPSGSWTTTPEAVVEGEWCLHARTYVWHYKRGNRVFSSVDRAKAVCEQRDGCGAVGMDRTPYRAVPGGPVIYSSTIYLLSVSDSERHPRRHFRYDTYMMGACEN